MFNDPEKRPGLEIVNGQMFIRPLEIGGVASDEEEDREEVDEESGMTSTYSSFTDRIRTERWGIEETRRFYKGLQQCGTDFTLMLAQFPGRTQKQLKNKFRKETRERPELVNMALDPRIAKPLNVDPYASAYGSGVVQEDENAPEGNGIGDAGASAIARAIAAEDANTSLRYLILENNSIGNEGARALASALASPSVQLEIVFLQQKSHL